jgi:hypothetical protein
VEGKILRNKMCVDFVASHSCTFIDTYHFYYLAALTIMGHNILVIGTSVKTSYTKHP